MTRVVPWSVPGDAASDEVPRMLTSVRTPAAAQKILTSPTGERTRVARWSRIFIRQLLVTDALSATVAIALGWLIRFGFSTRAITDAYIFWSVALTMGWLLCLHAAGAYDVRTISTGARGTSGFCAVRPISSGLWRSSAI